MACKMACVKKYFQRMPEYAFSIARARQENFGQEIVRPNAHGFW